MTDSDRGLQVARTLTRWLDQRFLDPLIGLLVPGAGDLLTGATGLYLVVIAVRRGLPTVVIARMLLNLGIDMLLGALPAFGDLFDFAWRANTRNLALLEARYPHRSATTGDWLRVGAAALFFVAALCVPIAILVATLRYIAGSM